MSNEIKDYLEGKTRDELAELYLHIAEDMGKKGPTLAAMVAEMTDEDFINTLLSESTDPETYTRLKKAIDTDEYGFTKIIDTTKEALVRMLNEKGLRQARTRTSIIARAISSSPELKRKYVKLYKFQYEGSYVDSSDYKQFRKDVVDVGLDLAEGDFYKRLAAIMVMYFMLLLFVSAAPTSSDLPEISVGIATLCILIGHHLEWRNRFKGEFSNEEGKIGKDYDQLWKWLVNMGNYETDPRVNPQLREANLEDDDINSTNETDQVQLPDQSPKSSEREA